MEYFSCFVLQKYSNSGFSDNLAVTSEPIPLKQRMHVDNAISPSRGAKKNTHTLSLQAPQPFRLPMAMKQY